LTIKNFESQGKTINIRIPINSHSVISQGGLVDGKGKDPIESAERNLEKAICVLERRDKGKWKLKIDPEKKTWIERFVKRGLKRGHFWIWKENREVLNDKNFLKVKDFENPGETVGFNIRSKDVELKWHWKAPKKPIKIHEESFEDWILNKNGKKKLKRGERLKRQHLVGDYDTHQKKWADRFVKKGLKRGHLWIWWNNHQIKNNNNFLEVKGFENPEGKIGFHIRSRKVKLKWHWKTLKEPIKIHKETYEEWLLKKAIHHGEEIIEEVG